MKLYHFTAERFLKGIQADGLTKGYFPLKKNDKTYMLGNCQWVTKRPGWNQAFHDPISTELKYDRREVRLKIVIPESRRENLWDLDKMKKAFHSKLIPDFFADPDCENWFVFYGRIKTQWIRDIQFNPEFKNDSG